MQSMPHKLFALYNHTRNCICTWHYLKVCTANNSSQKHLQMLIFFRITHCTKTLIWLFCQEYTSKLKQQLLLLLHLCRKHLSRHFWVERVSLWHQCCPGDAQNNYLPGLFSDFVLEPKHSICELYNIDTKINDVIQRCETCIATAMSRDISGFPSFH